MDRRRDLTLRGRPRASRGSGPCLGGGKCGHFQFGRRNGYRQQLRAQCRDGHRFHLPHRQPNIRYSIPERSRAPGPASASTRACSRSGDVTELRRLRPVLTCWRPRMPVGSNIKRAPLDNGLWTALGNTSGAIYSGLAGAGYVLRMAPFTVTAQTGFRVTGVALGGFNESGSELGLAVNSINYMSPSALASLDLPWTGGNRVPGLSCHPSPSPTSACSAIPRPRVPVGSTVKP